MPNTLRMLVAVWFLSLSAVLLPQASVAAEVTVTLSVPDMNCPACPITVRKSLERVDGVIKAESFAETKTAVVTFDDEQTDVPSLIEATTDYGYPSTLLDADS